MISKGNLPNKFNSSDPEELQKQLFNQSESYLLEITHHNIQKNSENMIGECAVFDQLELSVSQCIKQKNCPYQNYELLQMCHSMIECYHNLCQKLKIENSIKKASDKKNVDFGNQMHQLLKQYKEQLKGIKQQRANDKIIIQKLSEEVQTLKNEKKILKSKNKALQESLKKIKHKNQAQRFLQNQKIQKLIQNTIRIPNEELSYRNSMKQFQDSVEFYDYNKQTPIYNLQQDHTQRRKRISTVHQTIASPKDENIKSKNDIQKTKSRMRTPLNQVSNGLNIPICDNLTKSNSDFGIRFEKKNLWSPRLYKQNGLKKNHDIHF